MTNPDMHDWIIKGGRVVDPANDVDATMDLAIADGRIASIEDSMDENSARQIFDAGGKIVTPGLIDLHIHGYHLATPTGIDVDHYCLGRGVTTAVDAGSAGCDTFAGLRTYVADRVRTRLLAFLNISRGGMSFAGPSAGGIPGELDLMKLVVTEDCVSCIEPNRDLLIGVKIRLSEEISDEGRNEAESYRRALEAAAAVKLPIMVHHTFSTVPLEDCPGEMKTGDIYTHMFMGYKSTIVDPDKRCVEPVVREARERGVLFDVGHGLGSFSWPTAEVCAAEGFWPDTISTDIYNQSWDGPAYDLPTVMSKLLYLGMPLPDVIKATTIAPARAIGWGDRIGTLDVGREADVTVLALDEVDVDMEDCQAHMRRLRQRLSAHAVWRAGEPGELTQPPRWPNRDRIEEWESWRPHLVVRDDRVPE
jgi:dihydroorotase